MNKPTLYVTIGIPQSGKTTWAKKNQNRLNAVHISSDEIRKELYGDESIQGDGRKVFALVHKRIREALARGKNVIFDATSVARRKDIFVDYEGYPIVAVYFDIPLKVCLRRNEECRKRQEEGKTNVLERTRTRVVPDEVIKGMAKKLISPTSDEGWADIIIVNKF